MNIDELEVQPRAEYNLAGVHLGGMRDTLALEDVSSRWAMPNFEAMPYDLERH
jgi:hypothetical protein